MTVPTDNLPRHKDDFDRVYDLEDPSPYFTSLRPSDYRMPAVLAGALTAIHPSVRAAARRGRHVAGAGFCLRVWRRRGAAASRCLHAGDLCALRRAAMAAGRCPELLGGNAEFFAARRKESVAIEIAAMEARHPHLTTQKSFYVEISRARDRAELVTDDAAELRARSGRHGRAHRGARNRRDGPSPYKGVEAEPGGAEGTDRPRTNVEGPRTRRARPRTGCGHGPRAVDGSLQPCRATAGKRLKPPVSRIDRRLRARL